MSVECIYAPAGIDGSDGLLGLIIHKIADQCPAGVMFFTSKDCAQQVGYLKHPTGHIIPPHYHTWQQRVILGVPETLLVRKGRVLVNFYTTAQEYVCGRIVEEGDVVILLAGGHSFEIMEACELYEVRQGPYLNERDKVRFEDTAPTRRPDASPSSA